MSNYLGMEMITSSIKEITEKDHYNKLMKQPHLLIEITKEIASHVTPSME